MSMPLSVTILGYVATVITTGSFLPQAIKTIVTRDTRSISFFMYLLFVLGVFSWCVYGVISSQPPIWIGNGISTVLALIIFSYKIREIIENKKHKTE
ncbi:MAG: SemiSWEET transporter [Psittacicella sp.]